MTASTPPVPVSLGDFPQHIEDEPRPGLRFLKWPRDFPLFLAALSTSGGASKLALEGKGVVP